MAPMLAVPGTLVLLQQLSRHGARSPKTADYEWECPSDPFTFQWDTWNAELSGPGYVEAEAVGKVTKSRYGEWLGGYNGSQMRVFSEDSPRVLQSAEIAMYTLFPPGSGPENGMDNSPTFVPIHTIPENLDNLLSIEKAACKARSKAEYKVWWEAVGAAILEAEQPINARVAEVCGNTAESNGVLKDQVDGIGFDMASGFALDGFGAKDLLAAQNLSIVLQRGDFATDEQRTYLAGDLPATLLASMETAIAGTDQRYMGYFSHRHALMGLAEFLGWSWTQYNVPEGMVMTGTSVWFELRHGEEAGQYDVKLMLWTPRCAESDLEGCAVMPISLPGCKRGTTCSIEEFRAIVSDREARTGTWQTLCGGDLMV